MYLAKNGSKLVSWGLALVMGSIMAGTALASSNWVSDQRISLAKAEEMAEVARQGSDFPIVVNEMVLRQLNRYLGTEQGREFIRNGVNNMRGYDPILKAALGRYGMPEEILAVGMVESGFQNLPANQNPVLAAGVWQFIEGTARNFGLQVDANRDERLDVALATDAAFRYLKANQLRFQNRLLSILAYNIGENALQAGIQKYGTRKPWELLRKGLKTDPDYLPRVMAMVLILKNPDSLR